MRGLGAKLFSCNLALASATRRQDDLLPLRKQFLAEILFAIRHLQLAAGVAARD
jgi:hypothetical protein